MNHLKMVMAILVICCMAMAGTNTGGKVELTQTARDGIQIDASCILSGQINYSQVNEQQTGSGGTCVANANVQPDQQNVRAVHQEELLYCSRASTTTTVASYNGPQYYAGYVEVKNNSDQNNIVYFSSGQIVANQNYFADNVIKQTDNSVCVYRI
jgi:hypothetical protein